jgi:hypothetical protein
MLACTAGRAAQKQVPEVWDDCFRALPLDDPDDVVVRDRMQPHEDLADDPDQRLADVRTEPKAVKRFDALLLKPQVRQQPHSFLLGTHKADEFVAERISRPGDHFMRASPRETAHQDAAVDQANHEAAEEYEVWGESRRFLEDVGTHADDRDVREADIADGPADEADVIAGPAVTPVWVISRAVRFGSYLPLLSALIIRPTVIMEE